EELAVGPESLDGRVLVGAEHVLLLLHLGFVPAGGGGGGRRCLSTGEDLQLHGASGGRERAGEPLSEAYGSRLHSRLVVLRVLGLVLTLEREHANRDRVALASDAAPEDTVPGDRLVQQ